MKNTWLSIVFRPFKQSLTIAIVTTFLTGALPIGVAAAESECHSFYSGQSERPFEDWIRRQFWGSEDPHIPISLVMKEVSQSLEVFQMTYQELSPRERTELLHAIKVGYAEATRKKNRGVLQSGQLRRIMDGFINMEMDRRAPSIRSVDDLKAAFLEINKLVGLSETIDFAALESSAVYFQSKLQDRAQLDAYLSQPLPGINVRADVFRKQLQNELASTGTSPNLKVRLYGSVVNGRGIKGASDYDIHLAEPIRTALENYFLNDPATKRLEQFLKVKEITTVGIDPMGVYEDKALARSRWVIEITPTKISYLLLDPKTGKFRHLN